jgi:hypothetical protein
LLFFGGGQGCGRRTDLEDFLLKIKNKTARRIKGRKEVREKK